jgi:hypothetical protein
MNLDLYHHERGFQIVARNKFAESCEYISAPGDGIYEYVSRNGRLNMSFVVYCLTVLPERTDEQQAMLDFLNRANDHRRVVRKTRPKGWRNKAGISKGEVQSTPKKPGDVVVHGDVARAYTRIIGE